jgi:hypothetical protein
MAANTANISPIFTNAGNFTPARISASNTDNSGGGTLVAVVTGATDGTRVDGIRFNNSGSTTAASAATRINIFLTVGANIRLIGQVLFPVGATKTATVLGATAIYTFDQPIILKSGEIISVTSTNWVSSVDNIDACAFAGNY